MFVADKKKQDKKKEKVKLFTANPALLMAFVYFDQSRTNYLMDKDVEEIIHTVGLRLSRSQVRSYTQWGYDSLDLRLDPTHSGATAL